MRDNVLPTVSFEGSLVNTNAGKVAVIPEIGIELVHPNAVVPSYASEGDSGMDVYATEDIMLIAPGDTAIAKLGFKLDIPQHPYHELGYRWEVQARPRSGVSAKTALRVANAPGTIDNYYKNEVGIILTNTASEEIYVNHNADVATSRSNYAINLKGNRELVENANKGAVVPEGTIIIHKGDRIAQLVFNEVIRPIRFTVGKVGNTNDRGGGFGHTGI